MLPSGTCLLTVELQGLAVPTVPSPLPSGKGLQGISNSNENANISRTTVTHFLHWIKREPVEGSHNLQGNCPQTQIEVHNLGSHSDDDNVWVALPARRLRSPQALPPKRRAMLCDILLYYHFREIGRQRYSQLAVVPWWKPGKCFQPTTKVTVFPG